MDRETPTSASVPRPPRTQTAACQLCRLATQAQDGSGLRDPEASTTSTGHTTTEGLEQGPRVSDSLCLAQGWFCS